MRPIQVRPEYTMILKYDILHGQHESYFQFVMGEFVPGLQDMGMYMHRAWQVVWGNYPERHIEFITESREIQKFLENGRWLELEERLQEYIINYSRKVYKYTGTFQI